MSVIKQISVFDGNSWNTGNIGADASNIDISSSILGSGTNVQSALTTIGNKIGTTAIPSGLGTTITGAINTLNTNLTSEAIPNNTDINTIIKRGVYLLVGTFTYTNAPDTYGILEVLVPVNSGSIKIQRLNTLSTIYIRYYSNNNWLEWRRISSTVI